MPGRSHFNLFNKDTRDLFMLRIVFMCQLNCVVFYHCCSILSCSILWLLFVYFVRFLTFPFIFCSTFVLIWFFAFHCFVVQKKKIQFWSWIVFQVFRSCSTIVPTVQEIPSPSMQVNKHHTSDCTDFVLV